MKKSDTDEIVKQMQNRISVLEEENSLLSEQCGHFMLLSAIARNENNEHDYMDLLTKSLEQIGDIRNIPFCAAIHLDTDSAKVIAEYSNAHDSSDILLKDDPELTGIFTVSPDEPIIFKADESAVSSLCHKLNKALNTDISAVALIPFDINIIPHGVFIFCECREHSGELQACISILADSCQIITGRMETMVLSNQLQQLNSQLDNRMRQTTAALEQSCDDLATESNMRNRLETILSQILENTGRFTGEGFIKVMAEQLAKVLNVRWILIGEVIKEKNDTMKTLAVWDNGWMLPNFEYDLNHNGQDYHLNEAIVIKDGSRLNIFPEDFILGKMGAKNCMAVPLQNIDSHTTGILAALHDEDLPDGTERWGMSLLHTFAIRIAGEINRKRADNDLRRLAAAVRDAGESIMITDPSGLIQYVNPHFESMTGYTQNEVKGKNASILNSGRHDDSFYSELWGNLSDGKPWKGHFINKKKDGSLFEEEAVISPVLDRDGILANYVAVKRDLTTEHFLQRQLSYSQRMATVGQITRNIAHDFTNALTIILGHSDLISMEKYKPDKIEENIDIITDAARSIATLTSELLAFSAPKTFNIKKLRLNLALSGLKELAKKTVSPSIKLNLDISSVKEKVMVDSIELQHALMHMIINSADAMPEGGELVIKTRLATSQDCHQFPVQLIDILGLDNFAVVLIKDTGCGIPKDIQPRIFEPFFGRKRKEGCRGLGLATAFKIIDQHGGYITVESEVDQGATFRVFLPLYQQDNDQNSSVDPQSNR